MEAVYEGRRKVREMENVTCKTTSVKKALLRGVPHYWLQSKY